MNASTAINPMLVPERDAPYRLSGVYELIADGCREEFVLAFDQAALIFRVDPDTDALEIHFDDAAFAPSTDHRSLGGTALDHFIGREFGWSWLAVNQQGFSDTALLSFSGIMPNVLIHTIGSAVKVMMIDSTAF